MKDVIPKIKNERIAKAGVLLISYGQTGAALIQFASQTDSFTVQAAMIDQLDELSYHNLQKKYKLSDDMLDKVSSFAIPYCK